MAPVRFSGRYGRHSTASKRRLFQAAKPWTGREGNALNGWRPGTAKSSLIKPALTNYGRDLSQGKVGPEWFGAALIKGSQNGAEIWRKWAIEHDRLWCARLYNYGVAGLESKQWKFASNGKGVEHVGLRARQPVIGTTDEVLSQSFDLRENFGAPIMGDRCDSRKSRKACDMWLKTGVDRWKKPTQKETESAMKFSRPMLWVLLIICLVLLVRLLV